MTPKPEASQNVVAAATQIVDLVSKNESIQVDIQEAAIELASVNEMLNPEEYDPETIQAAHTLSIETESKISTAAAEMGEVNESLAIDLIERIDINIELINAQADLVEAREQLNAYKLTTEEAQSTALKDHLTGLPNRLAFDQRFEHGLIQAKRHNWGLAIFFIDVDNFKDINDTYGHAMGDQVLQMVANRLRSLLRDEDMVSRWGGDEFACLLLDVKNNDDMNHLAQKLVRRVAEDCKLDGVEFSIRISVGISLYPINGITEAVLLRHADAAMYAAKKSSNHVVVSKET